MRRWLGQPACEILKRVVAGHCVKAEIAAHMDAHKAMTDNNGQFTLLSNDNMRLAHRYQTFLDVLSEIQNRPTDQIHEIVKLK